MQTTPTQVAANTDGRVQQRGEIRSVGVPQIGQHSVRARVIDDDKAFRGQQINSAGVIKENLPAPYGGRHRFE